MSSYTDLNELESQVLEFVKNQDLIIDLEFQSGIRVSNFELDSFQFDEDSMFLTSYSNIQLRIDYTKIVKIKIDCTVTEYSYDNRAEHLYDDLNRLQNDEGIYYIQLFDGSNKLLTIYPSR